MREVDIDPCRGKSERGETPKDAECDGHIPPIPAKSIWQLVGKEVRNGAAAIGFGAIDLTVGTDNETVQIIDELWVACLSSRDRQIGSRTAIKFTELPNLCAAQA